eukprot:gnl/Hemi2/23215_TR7782_c0_g1_i2.p1 gnl/Hemi2/23215_TR7782_c0_g1~~gnl/Hemi2/23215_TR7782_c0_g1_i2.p1  ORF type:complete len:672 (-),score=156.75 gnl/Hemi2/23215_TR7782_c0_g1_i2:128-1843(-)
MLVGEEFLPKGDGTVTKRPLVLTLHDTSSLTGTPKYAIFPDLDKNSRITDFKVVERKILEQSKSLSDAPLHLDVYSPDVLNLRLVDLPGLIHNPVKGQANNSRKLIKDMCKKYISNDNTIILAITAANTDIQTSEALHFSRKFDPAGTRTISVLSKLDLVDLHEVRPLLDSVRNLSLRLGWVAVKCRSKQDREAKVTIAQARVLEDQFFAANPQYGVSGFHLGCRGLAAELSQILHRKVVQALPRIIETMRADLQAFRKQLAALGPGFVSPQQRDHLLLEEMGKFLKGMLGASAIDDIKVEIAQTIYSAVYQECKNNLTKLDSSKQEQGNFFSKIFGSKKLPERAPNFWDGQDDVRFQRWREQGVWQVTNSMHNLSESLTYRVIDLLRSRIQPSATLLETRPLLQEVLKQTTDSFLNRNYEETVAHVQFLINLERNVSYDNQWMDQRIRVMLGGDTTKKDKGWFGSEEKQTVLPPSADKFGSLWTEAYYELLTERLSTNIYNTFCVEILDRLESRLQELYTVQVYGTDGDRRANLLQEKSDVQQQRLDLVNQIDHIEEAKKKLELLAMGTI